MINIHLRSLNILTMMLGLLFSHTAAAQKIQVTSADPASGIQGTSADYIVEITGNGFGDDIDEVIFLLPCDEEGCDDNTGGISQKPFTVKSNKKITVPINLLNAEIADFDIRVSSSTRGRGGKGTTFRALKLFKVKPKPKSGFSLHDITTEYTGLAWEEAFQPGDPDFPPGWENWTDNTLSQIPRPCFVGVHLVDPPSGGRYDCSYEDEEGGMISIDLAGIKALYEEDIQSEKDIWVAVTSGKKTPPNPEFCELLNRWEEFPNDVLPGDRLPLEFGTHWYAINFMQGCTDIDCHVGISHQSYNGDPPKQGPIQLHPFHDLDELRLPTGMDALPDVGRLIVKTWATGVPAPDDYNAFIQPQTLEIEGLEIRFGNTKNGAVLAACRTLEGTVGGVFLETCPDPFGCDYDK